MGRVGQRAGDASDATLEFVKHQENYDIGPLDWHVIDASGTPEQTLQRSKAKLGTPETNPSPIVLDPQ
jgi:predicted kinase